MARKLTQPKLWLSPLAQHSALHTTIGQVQTCNASLIEGPRGSRRARRPRRPRRACESWGTRDPRGSCGPSRARFPHLPLSREPWQAWFTLQTWKTLGPNRASWTLESWDS
jgi:hypothetical protein